MNRKFSFSSSVHFLLFSLFLLTSFSACSASGSASAGLAPEQLQDTRMKGAAGEQKRLMTYAASLSVEVSQVESLDADVKQLVSSRNGFLLESNTGSKNYYAKIQVPADKLNETIEALSRIGEVESKSVNAQDVTNTYTDLQAKIKNLTALRDRYRLILEKAKDMKDILAVEQELNRVQGELERTEAQFTGLKEQISYSTISFRAKVSTILGPLGYVVQGASWIVTKLFVIR